MSYVNDIAGANHQNRHEDCIFANERIGNLSEEDLYYVLINVMK